VPYEQDTRPEPCPNRSLAPRHKSKSRKRNGTVVNPPEVANGTVVKPPEFPIGTVVKPPDSPNGTVVNPHEPQSVPITQRQPSRLYRAPMYNITKMHRPRAGHNEGRLTP
jgi:hypothetical protein